MKEQCLKCERCIETDDGLQCEMFENGLQCKKSTYTAVQKLKDAIYETYRPVIEYFADDQLRTLILAIGVTMIFIAAVLSEIFNTLS